MNDGEHPLAGHGALVTGASRRIGRAIAIALAEAGCDLAIHFRTDERGARETAAAVEATGRSAFLLRADLTDADACRTLADDAEQALNGVDLLVNNASIFRRSALDTMDEQDFDDHLAANTRPVYLLSTLLGRRMLSRSRGTIVNIADTAGLRPWAGFVPYSASKAAVLSLTEGFAKLLAPSVRVNAIAPGPMLPAADSTPEQDRKAVAATLLKRWGAAEDIADAVVYLATAPYVTGVLLPVDGGRSIA